LLELLGYCIWSNQEIGCMKMGVLALVCIYWSSRKISTYSKFSGNYRVFYIANFDRFVLFTNAWHVCQSLCLLHTIGSCPITLSMIGQKASISTDTTSDQNQACVHQILNDHSCRSSCVNRLTCVHSLMRWTGPLLQHFGYFHEFDGARLVQSSWKEPHVDALAVEDNRYTFDWGETSATA